MNHAENPTDRSTRFRNRSGAITIALGTILVFVFLAHHPVLSPGGGASEVLSGIVAVARHDMIVHGALIAVFALFGYGYIVFGQALGLGSTPVLAGTVAYLFGCVAVVGAALIDGFITPLLATRFANAPDADVHVAYAILIFGALAIQSLTKLGLLLLSSALLAWAIALYRAPLNLKWNAAVAATAGVIPVLFLATSAEWLGPHSLIAIFAVQALWNVAVAILLWGPALTKPNAPLA